MISYYELLEMIHNGTIPAKVMIHLNSGKASYVAKYDGGQFNYYEIENKDEQSENNKFYLSDCLLDSEMFDKCIEYAIPKKKISKLEYTKKQPKHRIKKIEKKLNEVIDIINKMSD